MTSRSSSRARAQPRLAYGRDKPSRPWEVKGPQSRVPPRIHSQTHLPQDLEPPQPKDDCSTGAVDGIDPFSGTLRPTSIIPFQNFLFHFKGEFGSAPQGFFTKAPQTPRPPDPTPRRLVEQGVPLQSHKVTAGVEQRAVDEAPRESQRPAIVTGLSVF